MKKIFYLLSLFTILTAECCSEDVLDFGLIYNDSFSYSMPRPIVESFLSGKAFDNPVPYTPEESANLREDIYDIYNAILADHPHQENIAIMTAGAPGAGKTWKMRQDIAAKKAQGIFYAYIDPDDVCLKSQTRTYLAEIQSGDNTLTARTQAYTKWRPGSNAATHLILGNLIRKNLGFYFGTTSTGPATGKSFAFLKQQGYRIRLLHISAPDDVRWESIKERDKSFVQTTEADVREKGLLLPQRIADAYLKYADEIEFYYRDEVKKDALIAAKWLRSQEEGSPAGSLEIIDLNLYEKIKSLHNEAVKGLGRPDLLWELTVELTLNGTRES